jgi:hypothetical protein
VTLSITHAHRNAFHFTAEPLPAFFGSTLLLSPLALDVEDLQNMNATQNLNSLF